MEKIYFDENTYIWKTKVNRINDKVFFLNEAHSIIKSQPSNNTDGYGYKHEWQENINFIGEINIQTKLDEIVKVGIDACIEIYKEKNINYNKINTDAWVNVVRAKNPVQKNFYNDNKYYT